MLVPTRFPVLQRTVILIMVLFGLTLVGCDEKKKSEGGGKSESASGGGGGGGGGGTVEGHQKFEERGPETDEGKADRVMRQLTNYLMGIATTEGAPEDLASAKELLQLYNSIRWTKDPWGNEYNYEKTGDTEFRVWSSGPDGQSGTADDLEGKK